MLNTAYQAHWLQALCLYFYFIARNKQARQGVFGGCLPYT